MTTETGAPAGESAAPAIQDDGVSALNIEEARALLDQRMTEPEDKEPATAADAPAEQNSSQEDDADPETDPREETEADEPEDKLPPIERPRSWAKDLDEEWASYPRAAQEKIVAREQERDAAFRRSQNELAEQRKVFETERQAALQLKTEYESKLPSLVKTLEDALQSDFADIQNISDVRKLQAEDPFRFQQWQLRQMELSAAQTAKQESDKKAAEETQASWGKYTQEQGAKFFDALSDGDKKNIKSLMNDAPKFLEDRGFSNQELADLWNGKDKLSLHDHRIQSLILDGMKFRDIQNAPKLVAKKDLPPVQKPGHAGAVNSTDANIKALEKRFNSSGSLEDAWALQEARMKTSSRRAS